MSFTPTAGMFAAAQLGPGAIGTNTNITVPGINWNLDHDAKAHDVSNFRDGRRRTGTLPDYTLTLTLVWDSAANPLLPANGGVALGSLLNVTLYTEATNNNEKAWFGPVIVSKLGPKNEGVEGVVMMDVTCDANGTLVPPST
jgi:hypothetical protein